MPQVSFPPKTLAKAQRKAAKTKRFGSTRNAFRLTPRQTRFVLAYAADANATQAAIAAGYAPANAAIQGNILLDKPHVRDAVQRQMDAVVAVSAITKQTLARVTWELVQECRRDRQRNAAFRGIELLAKMHGYIIEKRDIRVVKSWEDLSDEELKALAGPVEPPPEPPKDEG
jgi:hypothetical protein